VSAHPNAAVGGSTATGALVVVWILGRVGVTLTAEEGAVIAGAASTLALLIGRNGVKGVVGMVWHGSKA
jgi:hypothetical protein